MNRRTALAWLSRVLATSSALLVAIPSVTFFFRGSAFRQRNKGVTQRVARLSDLPVGKPVQVNVMGARRDAWTAYPDETIGRVWLIRAAGGSETDAEPVVNALASVCPHLGCAVQLDANGKQFVCPCHRASFALSGNRLSGNGRPSHAPRDLDTLDCRVVRDATNGELWVEIYYQQFEPGLTKKVAKA